MKRDPSIHVKRSSLIKELTDLVENPEMVVDELFHNLHGDAIRNRVIVQPNARTKKTMERVASVDKKLAEAFHAVYQQINLQNNIKTTSIKSTDSKYATLKEVAHHANEFCEMFEIEQGPGFQAYVTIAIRLAGNNYSIYRLKALGDKIINYYKNMSELDNDEDRDATTRFNAAWKTISIKYLGYATAITEPHLYVHFIHGRKAADKAKAPYPDWVAAQYEKWAEIDSTPALSQLYGDNANLAYSKYAGLKNKQYDSPEEKTYFESKKVTSKKIQRKGSKS